MGNGDHNNLAPLADEYSVGESGLTAARRVLGLTYTSRVFRELERQPNPSKNSKTQSRSQRTKR
jgi:hypothetical protein